MAVSLHWLPVLRCVLHCTAHTLKGRAWTRQGASTTTSCYTACAVSIDVQGAVAAHAGGLTADRVITARRLCNALCSAAYKAGIAYRARLVGRWVPETSGLCQ